MGDATLTKKRPSCGLFNLVFKRRSILPRRSPSTAAVNHVTNSIQNGNLDDSKTTSDSPKARKKTYKSPHIHQHTHKLHHSKSRNSAAAAAKIDPRISPRAGFGLSGELDSIITDSQPSKGNLAVFGNLGNLRQNGNGNTTANGAAEHHVNGKYPTSVMGNVVKKTHVPENPISLCRSLSTRMDPEKLKTLGNEHYRNCRFAEALSLYNAAISIDPNKDSYRSNKSAALVALGKLLEAALECREAIRINPLYQRAHNRLALIYVRLGEAESALYHLKQAESDADPDAMERAKKIQIHLSKCSEAKREKDWNTVMKEASLAINEGADSAALIYGLRAQALLKMNRHQEAIETMQKNPNFDIDLGIKLFGSVACSTLLVFQAQVDLASGRFDDAVAAAERAAKLDPNSKEASKIRKKARGVAGARFYGNELFRAGRYSEACIIYGEGLRHDSYNAVLLCNRAACRSKLGQWEKAVEDCDGALRVWPSYSKPRLRRADCYAKMGKWRACVQDCEELFKECSGNEEIRKMREVAIAQERN